MTAYNLEKATACANLRYELERLHMLQTSMETTLGELRDCESKIVAFCNRLQEIEYLEEAQACHG